MRHSARIGLRGRASAVRGNHLSPPPDPTIHLTSPPDHPRNAAKVAIMNSPSPRVERVPRALLVGFQGYRPRQDRLAWAPCHTMTAFTLA